jgi:hypothetical protein
MDVPSDAPVLAWDFPGRTMKLNGQCAACRLFIVQMIKVRTRGTRAHDGCVAADNRQALRYLRHFDLNCMPHE